MGFQTKITLFALPILFAAVAGVGSWAFITARDNIFQYTHEQMDIVLTETIAHEFTRRATLLKSTQMDKVDFFVREYQAETCKALNRQTALKGGHFLIFTPDKTPVFQPPQVTPEIIGALTETLTTPDGSVSLPQKGRYNAPTGRPLFYTAVHFKPWDWVVVYFMEASRVHGTIDSLFLRTGAVILLFVVIGIAGLVWIFQRVLVRRVMLLKQAAAEIADQQSIRKIDIRSQDELGDLARSMETMSEKLHDHHQKQQTMQQELMDLNDQLRHANTSLNDMGRRMEDEVARRTQNMESINIELSANLDAITQELDQVNQKRNRLTEKVSELILKQADMVQSNATVVRQLKVSHDANQVLREQMKAYAGMMPESAPWGNESGGDPGGGTLFEKADGPGQTEGKDEI